MSVKDWKGKLGAALQRHKVGWRTTSDKTDEGGCVDRFIM